MSVDEGGSAGGDRSGGRIRNAAEVGALVTIGVAVVLSSSLHADGG
jgi:hypothetical protein